MSIFKKENRDSKKALARINEARIRYVTRREENGTERVVGRSGAVSVNDERVVLLCEGRSVFCCGVDKVRCSELLSGDGAVLSGVDLDSGEEMTVTAHFTSVIRK